MVGGSGCRCFVRNWGKYGRVMCIGIWFSCGYGIVVWFFGIMYGVYLGYLF